MYYVIRKGEKLEDYHSKFTDENQARDYAEGLRKTFGHHYDVVKVETVWTTTTLHELMQDNRKRA